MTDIKRDPAKEPQDPKFEPRFFDKPDWDNGRMGIGGPGGSSILTENNEKGILEAELQTLIGHNKTAALGAEHPRQGIYTSND